MSAGKERRLEVVSLFQKKILDAHRVRENTGKEKPLHQVDRRIQVLFQGLDPEKQQFPGLTGPIQNQAGFQKGIKASGYLREKVGYLMVRDAGEPCGTNHATEERKKQGLFIGQAPHIEGQIHINKAIGEKIVAVQGPTCRFFPYRFNDADIGRQILPMKTRNRGLRHGIHGGRLVRFEIKLLFPKKLKFIPGQRGFKAVQPVVQKGFLPGQVLGIGQNYHRSPVGIFQKFPSYEILKKSGFVF